MGSTGADEEFERKAARPATSGCQIRYDEIELRPTLLHWMQLLPPEF